jgi:6-phosphogluconolactonase
MSISSTWRFAAAAAAAMAVTTSAAVAADCERIYIGTHAPGGAPSLFTAQFNGRDGSFGPASAVASIERPTWLVKDPARALLYTVSETGNDGATHGKVFSLRIAADGALAEVGAVASGGGGPTHLALDARAGTLLVANYGTGHVAALAVAAGGALAGPASVVQDQGSGPIARQRGPHAHGVTIDPSGRYALVPDLGADRVFVYRYDAATRQLAPAATPFVQLPPGSGPRHLVFSGDGRHAYLVAEFTGELLVYAWDAAAGRLQVVQTLSTLTAAYGGKISAGEIIVSGGGGQVYVSNRGDHTVIVYQVDKASGRLAEVQRVPAGGDQPWHLALSPDGRWLLASNEASNAVNAFRVADDGRLAVTAHKLDVVKPSSVVFAGACADVAASVQETAIQLGNGIQGTLVLPLGGAPAPVALLVADAGKVDRDGNGPRAGNDSLRQLARALAAQGIASVRYDRRGVGASISVPGADQKEAAQHAADAAQWIELLKKDSRFNKVVVIGHGGGTLVGLLAANVVGANGFVALAGGGELAAAEFGKLKMHARIIRGDADRQFGEELALQLERARPGTPMVVIAGMTHMLQASAGGDSTVAPELVTALAGFINKR